MTTLNAVTTETVRTYHKLEQQLQIKLERQVEAVNATQAHLTLVRTRIQELRQAAQAPTPTAKR